VSHRVCPAGHDLADGEVFCRIHGVQGQPPTTPADHPSAGGPTAGGPETQAATWAKPAPSHPARGEAAAPRVAAGPAGEGAPARCWNCDEPVAAASNTQCLNCHQSLTPPDLVLDFGASNRIPLRGGGSVVLGRDPEVSEWFAMFAGHLSVSRRHATVGVDERGEPWVQDDGAMNGTFVNGAPIPRSRRIPLRDGDELQLTSDVSAQVRAPKRETP